MKNLNHYFLSIFTSALLTLCVFSVPSYAFHDQKLDTNMLEKCRAIKVADSGKEEAAKKFVDGVAQRGIAFLSDESLTQDQRKVAFKKLLRSSFDMKTIGRFSLGRFWRTASKKEQGEYLKLFEKSVVESYAARFEEYQGQELEVRGARAEGKNDVIVTSFLVPDSGSEVQVDWRVRKKSGKYKVVDVIVEGVSMALTQRSDFASVIQRGGGEVEVLLAHLR